MSDNVSKFDVQPMPIGEGRPVTPEVIQLLNYLRTDRFIQVIHSRLEAQRLIASLMVYVLEQKDATVYHADEGLAKCIEVVEAQSAAGLKKYGTTLRIFNGRDADLDTLQELADALQYTTQADMEDETEAQETAP